VGRAGKACHGARSRPSPCTRRSRAALERAGDRDHEEQPVDDELACDVLYKLRRVKEMAAATAITPYRDHVRRRSPRERGDWASRRRAAL
jgi:hypothetical protein